MPCVVLLETLDAPSTSPPPAYDADLTFPLVCSANGRHHVVDGFGRRPLRLSLTVASDGVAVGSRHDTMPRA
jgi:hypothetical protein